MSRGVDAPALALRPKRLIRALPLALRDLLLRALPAGAMDRDFLVRHFHEGTTGAEIGFAYYLTTGAFYEATFENWESEFLQMAAFIFLTARPALLPEQYSRRP